MIISANTVSAYSIILILKNCCINLAPQSINSTDLVTEFNNALTLTFFKEPIDCGKGDTVILLKDFVRILKKLVGAH